MIKLGASLTSFMLSKQLHKVGRVFGGGLYSDQWIDISSHLLQFYAAYILIVHHYCISG